MKRMTAWEAAKLSDVMTIAEAACCIIGIPPTNLGSNTGVEPYLYSEDPRGFDDENTILSRVVASIKNSIKARKLAAVSLAHKAEYTHVCYVDGESQGAWEPIGNIDAWETLVEIDVLKDWLLSRNCRPDFFFPEALPEVPDYLNQNHPKYSGRLAAAVRAWEAVAAEEKDGKTPKQWLEKWLREHAAQFSGMTKDDGSPSEKAVGECSTVANWKAGGPAKTPG